jgi:hypothetical protein
VRGDVVYRTFTGIDAGEMSDAKTLKIARTLGPDGISTRIAT